MTLDLTMKQIAVFLLLLLVCVEAFCQSERSNELYAKGVELYQAGKYKEAIPLFESALALDTIEMGPEKCRRKSCEPWVASSYYKAGDLENAKKCRRYEYDLPTIDRRLTVASDSLCDEAMKLVVAGRAGEAVPLFEKMREMEIDEMGGESLLSVGTTSMLSFVYSFIGDKEKAVKAALSAIETNGRLYGAETRSQALWMQNACNVFLNIGDINLYDAMLRQMLSFLVSIGEENDELAEKMLNESGALYDQVGDYEKKDALDAFMKQRIKDRYGAESIELLRFLTSRLSSNLNLKRFDVVLSQVQEVEDFALRVEGEEGDHRIIAKSLRGIALLGMGQTKAAVKELRQCLKLSRKKNNPEIIAPIISTILMAQSVLGKEDKQLLEEAVTLLDNFTPTDDNLWSYASSSVSLAEALAINQRFHEAAMIVNRSMEVYERRNQYAPLFMSCLILLLDGQYVQARQASSKGLELLNKELSYQYAAMAVNQSKDNINAALTMVANRQAQEGGVFAADTTKYSLAMIQQDLLQSKLAILDHQDSIGSDVFISTLAEYARIAYVQTKDEVMGDSILQYYGQKIQDAYGKESPRYLLIQQIKERCAFEKTSKGHLAAFRLTLVKEGSEEYQEFQRQYEEAFALWKANGGKDPDEEGLTAKDYKKYDPPYLWRLNEENAQSVADSCLMALQYLESILPTAKFANDTPPYWYMRDLIKTWCVSMEIMGRQEEVVPNVRKWHALLRDTDDQVLFTLCWAWLCGRESDYGLLEQEVAGNDLKDREVLHAAVMFKALKEMTDVSSYDSKKWSAKTKKELDETILKMQATEQYPDRLADKMFIHRSMIYWKYYWKLDFSDKRHFKSDFLKIYELLEKHPELQGYRDAYEAMNVLCEIAGDYSYGDDALVVKADQMRQAVKRTCIKVQQQKEEAYTIAHWPQFFSSNAFLRFLTTITYNEKDLEDLEERIRYAYMREKATPFSNTSEQYDDVMASWNEIRELQKKSFSDSKALMDKIEKLTTQVCQYLDDENVSDTIRSLAYDIALFGKGYLLRSEQQQRKVILQSGNRTVLRQYDEYLKLQQQLDNSSLSDEEIKELTSKTQEMWQNLRYASKSFDDYTKTMEASWKSVRDALAADEVAIEYLRSGELLNPYYALILKREYTAPLVAKVGWETRFTEQPDSLYTIRGKYSTPWPFYISRKDREDIHPLEGVKRIFVSPTGALHQLSLESMRNLFTDSVMSDQYQIFRVTSTRELMERKHEKKQLKAMLYGGVNYQLGADEWETLALERSSDKPQYAMRDVPMLSRGAVESALQPLTGTVQEVEDISNVFAQQKMDAVCLMGSKATEDHLKALSGSSYNVLHIATHGFYQSERDAKDVMAVTFARDKRTAEANALSRSGLFMAGASAVFDETPIPFNVDDGILTALEISHLDLTNMNMVTLSACETGLGDITGDGVFGLQRGFKKAGAQSILMSLWKVDDEATCMLMTEFYKNWVGRQMTKHDALETAKRTVRSHKEKGWDNPKYWAAFILLDGLD